MTPRPKRPPSFHEQAVLELAERRSLFRARDVLDAGIPSMTLSRLVQAGRLQRISHGVYAPRERDVSEHVSLAEVCMRAPRAVVCLLSALRFHDIGTQEPGDVWIALPPNVAVPRITSPAVRVTRMSGESFSEGITEHVVDGVRVPVFDIAKTIADCFKFRNKIGLDVGLEAIRDGWSRQAFLADDLWHYATLDRVTNVMRPYMESLIT
ncbi:transcriptional regulator [Roseateles aquatilis]|uniref:Transcriptional regulator n=1 Tax=Roseateles aquatilis TaxID=431061 RepID=A0A246JN26_9BURK|nr:type IV toxin-antitoxin system AbiEi family antitoxin domain-containing protein [Roseateles aquatilis]OWQ93903.1 transcriptional regulator [Roseateles aquatilis]